MRTKKVDYFDKFMLLAMVLFGALVLTFSCAMVYNSVMDQDMGNRFFEGVIGIFMGLMSITGLFCFFADYAQTRRIERERLDRSVRR